MTKKMFEMIKRDIKKYGTGLEYQEINKYNITFTIYVGFEYLHIVVNDNEERQQLIYNIKLEDFLQKDYNSFCRYENECFYYGEWEGF